MSRLRGYNPTSCRKPSEAAAKGQGQNRVPKHPTPPDAGNQVNSVRNEMQAWLIGALHTCD